MNTNHKCEDNSKRAFKTDSSSSNSQLNEAFDAGSNCASGTDNFVSCEESVSSDRSSIVLAGKFVNGAKQGISQIVQSFTDSTIIAGYLENNKKDDTFDEVTTILNELVSLPLNNQDNESKNIASIVDPMTEYKGIDKPKSLDLADSVLEKQDATSDRYTDLILDDLTPICQICKNKFQRKIQTIGRDVNYNLQQALSDQCIRDGRISKRVPLTKKNLKEHNDLSSQYLRNRIVPNKQYCISPRHKPSSSKVLTNNMATNSTKSNTLKKTYCVDRLTTLLEESQNERQQEELANTKFIQDESLPQWAPSFYECSIVNNQSQSRASCAHNLRKGTNSKVSCAKKGATARTDDSFLYLEHLCKVCDNSVMKNTSTDVKHNISSNSSSRTALDLICDNQMASLSDERSFDLHTKLLRELIETKKLCRDLIDTHPQGTSDPRLRRTRQSIDNFLKVLTQEESMIPVNKKKMERSVKGSGNNVSQVVNASPIKSVSSLRKIFSPKQGTCLSTTTSSSSSLRRSTKSPRKNVRLYPKSSPVRVVQRSPKKLSCSKPRATATIPTTPRRRLPILMVTESTPSQEKGYSVRCAGTNSASKIFVTPSKGTETRKSNLKLRPRKYFADLL